MSPHHDEAHKLMKAKPSSLEWMYPLRVVVPNLDEIFKSRITEEDRNLLYEVISADWREAFAKLGNRTNQLTDEGIEKERLIYI